MKSGDKIQLRETWGIEVVNAERTRSVSTLFTVNWNELKFLFHWSFDGFAQKVNWMVATYCLLCTHTNVCHPSSIIIVVHTRTSFTIHGASQNNRIKIEQKFTFNWYEIEEPSSQSSNWTKKVAYNYKIGRTDTYEIRRQVPSRLWYEPCELNWVASIFFEQSQQSLKPALVVFECEWVFVLLGRCSE